MSSRFESGAVQEVLARWRAGGDAASRGRVLAAADALAGGGLDRDEAVLVALLREERAAAPPPAQDPGRTEGRSRPARDALLAFAAAALAALLVKLPELFGGYLHTHPEFYARNLSLFVLPLLAANLAWQRGASRRAWAGLAAAFALAALAANLPGVRAGDLAGLAALHLPVALWLAVGIAHAGGRWREAAARLAFVRFTGELAIHYALIALGGIVLCGLAMMLFQAAGLDAEPFFERWLLPCGALGALPVAAWWVERDARQAWLAPMLVKLFTPMFAALLLAFLATLALPGRGLVFHRELLIGFDALLVVVLGLVVLDVAARDARRPPGAMDRMQLVLLASALAVDAAALWTIGARIGELGATPNRLAALGLNLVLLVNLAVAAGLQWRRLRGRGAPDAPARWQARYVPVYAAWAAFVVIAFPWIFG